MRIRISLIPGNFNSFIDEVALKYHFDDGDKPSLKAVFSQVEKRITPYAIYKINQRVTGVKEIDDGQAAVVAMTLGEEVDFLIDEYEKTKDITSVYMADCICNELMLRMYGEFNRIYAKFHRRYVARYYFIGDEIPLSKIDGLLHFLQSGKVSHGDESEENQEDDYEIKANEYGVLTPSKSVVLYAVLSENPNVRCVGICANCGNVACNNRIDSHNIETYNMGVNNKAIIYSYGFQRIYSGEIN